MLLISFSLHRPSSPTFLQTRTVELNERGKQGVRVHTTSSWWWTIVHRPHQYRWTIVHLSNTIWYRQATMCGRFGISFDQAGIERRFGAQFAAEGFTPRYNAGSCPWSVRINRRGLSRTDPAS